MISTETFEKMLQTDYRHRFNVTATQCLQYLQKASDTNQTIFKLIHLNNQDFQLKIYSPNKQLIISDIFPFIENLGFKIIDIQAFNIHKIDNIAESWIYSFELAAYTLPHDNDFNLLCADVESALNKMFEGALMPDSLCRLIAICGFQWHRIKLLRALTRYLRQIGFQYSEGYVQSMLIKHFNYTKLLVDLFDAKFNPIAFSLELVERVHTKAKKYLKLITNNAEDKVLSSMLNLIRAMVRTNYYQLGNNEIKNYISFKFNSHKIHNLPLPIPYAEIFVYSNYFEAIHLRGGKVSRGGIRWSDREEDYRTEVLGLMKAQMTKNAVIVPVGSKGGFFILINNEGMTRQEYMDKVIESYKNFLRGMLDITDNIIDGQIQNPKNTIIHDENDPYLVVAADKGTATFSDYANQVSQEYNFWLRDAFASGGSSGYDHKKIGITAKGAWISVQQHFQEMGIDVQTQPITVVGIGDMSGDVFGNGMLRSKTIQLVAAFNHTHIFIDPTPDQQKSFNERLRLFNLPSSQWSDYAAEIISKGGGIFERSAKVIVISPEIKNLLDITKDEMQPEELIRAILCANVDLLWNGGIGTYVKASHETHLNIGDKTNDNLRCDAKNIRAKVIAEGGNLGLSQQGRIEYAKHGGCVNTDFIDNSGGVSCSDYEVNIKIALNNAVQANKLTLLERNKLLINMTPQVETLVLMDNYKQTQAIAITQLSTALNIEMFSQIINVFEEEKLLNRNIEFLPNAEEFATRAAAKEKLTRPELALLLSYSKMSVYNDLLNAKLTHDKYFEQYLINYFPQDMREKFKHEILTHPLRHEIIRTIITNKIVNQLSGPIINTIKRETGGLLCDIVRSYVITCDIFNLNSLWAQVESLSNVKNDIKIEMFTELARIMRRGSAWFIQNLMHPIDVIKVIDEFAVAAQSLSIVIAPLLLGEAKNKFDDKLARYKLHGVPLNLSNSIATLDSLISVFDIINVAKQTRIKDSDVTRMYFAVGNKFHIDWLRKVCEKQIDDSYWNRLSIQSIKDDLYDKQRRLLVKIISTQITDLNLWIEEHKLTTNIFFDFVEKIQKTDNLNLNMIILANKKFEMFLRKL